MSADQTILRLREKLHVERERRTERGDPAWDARCPAHHDSHASLVFGPGRDDETGDLNGKTVVHCHAGCSTSDVLDAIGMDLADLQGEPHIVATYPYLDEDGIWLYTVQRWEPKDFRVDPGLPPTSQRRLYHSEWLRAARTEGRRVWIVEGEKDADAMAKAGEIAVCGAGGAGKWLAPYTDQLAGLDVTVVADDDEPGRKHARTVARALDGKASSVTICLPTYGKDISDHLAAGYGLDKVVPLSINPDMEIHRADQLVERPVAWLWPGFLPMGKLVLIDGDPGDGKSVMTCDLAARLSRGGTLPDGTRSPLGPISSVMISAEDDPEDTIKPRLRVAGADLRRITLITGGSAENSPFDLGTDLDALEAHITENKIGLCVIDPLMAFLPGTVDTHRDADVRRALHPLSRMAMRTGCVILIVRHMTKGRTKAITAGGGSIGIIGAARVGYMIAPHPEDESQRVMSCVKINVARRPEPLAYKIVPCPETPDAPMIEWSEDRPEISAQDLIDGVAALDEREARSDARGFLANLLEENPTRGVKWVDVIRAGKKEGHSDSTLRRVRSQLAECRVNPITPEGVTQSGTFWFVRGSVVPGAPVWTVVPDAEDAEDEPAEPAEGEDTGEPAGEHSEPRLAAVVPTTGGCDYAGCDAGGAVTFGAPYHCRRCSEHNPLLMGE